jgi:hypothetical protein
MSSFMLSKFGVYKVSNIKSIKLNVLKVSAGLFKPNFLYLHHHLFLSSLTALPAAVKYQIHGKRRRLTTSLYSSLYKKYY